MRVISTVGRLSRGAVGVACSTARHPVATAGLTVGVAKGIAEAGIALVRGAAPHDVPRQRAERPTAQPAPESAPVAEPAAVKTPPRPVADTPDPDDLPEPIVIRADDAPAPGTGEPFATEPKATSRLSEHEGAPDDLDEARDEADEVLHADQDDLVLVEDEPLLDPGVAKAVLSESATMAKAADVDKG